METGNLFFNDWKSLWRILVIAIFAYAGLVIFLRVSGKRTLSKMNAFDLVVTVALGSTFATVLLSKDVALADGLTAFFMLIALQYVVASLSIRSARFKQVIKSQPTLLFYRGHFLSDSLKQQRVSKDEVVAAIRQQGIGTIDEVDAVVLETDASLSVIRKPSDGNAPSTIENVRGYKADSQAAR